MTESLQQKSEGTDETSVLAYENLMLKRQIKEILTLNETGVFTEPDQLQKLMLDKALVLCPSSESFIAMSDETPGSFKIKVANNLTEEKGKSLIEGIKTKCKKWLEDESPLIEYGDYVYLPLLRHHKILGIIGLKPNDDCPRYTYDILPLLTYRAAASIENAILYDRMFKRLLMLSNVFILGKEIVTNIELTSLVDKFLAIVSDGTSSEAAAVFLVKGTTDLPYFTRLQCKNKNINFAPNTLDGYTELIRAVHIESKYRLINNLEETEFAPFEEDKIPGIIIKKTLVIPLKTPDKLLGILQVANKTTGGQYTSDDADLLNILSSQLAFVIQNADLFNNLQRAYFDTLSALTSAIDAKDSYTRGHSERVTELSIKLAEECNLAPSDIENIKIGGLLHDIGKIGIPEAVLNKPGRLNDEEFNIIKSHPDLGLHILGKVEFLEHIVPIIRHHHERYDGRGYPAGLKGTEIPLLARIVSVVDTFDAMTTNRPYRKALTIEESLLEIEKCSGTQFDPEIAAKFVAMVRRDGIKFELGDMSLPQTYETILHTKQKGIH